MSWSTLKQPPSLNGEWHYFAYSFTLDPAFREAFSRLSHLPVPQFTSPEAAELKQADLVYRAFRAPWNGRIAGFEPGTASVYGQLYSLSDSDKAWVQAAERSISAVPRSVEVTVAGKKKSAIAFIPTVTLGDDVNSVSEAFVAHLLTGLAGSLAPAAYVDQLFAEAAVLESVQRFERQQRKGVSP